MLHCVVIDDESLARDVLAEYLSRLDCVASVQYFGLACEAVTYLESHTVDVLFLDIEMPGLNGLDLLKSLAHPPITVFTTAYRDYAFEGFELGVIDFLLKPIAFNRFSQSIDKIRDFLSLKEQNDKLDDAPADALLDFVVVKSGLQRIKLNFEDVLYIQGLKDYAIIYTRTGKIVIKGSIKAMQAIFPSNRFIRVHKSFIAALPRISCMERNRLLVNGHQIPIGRNYKEDVDKALFNRTR